MRWRLFLTEPLPAADNMALDEALMQRARTSREHVLRVYGWTQATLSLGRNQRAVGVFDKTVVERGNVAIVRRLTGGRAVLHDREVTYSVSGPASRGDTLRASYASINQILVTALRALGVPAALARKRSDRLPVPGSAPCFELPAEGEIVVGDRKLVGSAQVREDGAFLQHGSILIDDDQPRVSELSTIRIPHTAAAATLREVLGAAPPLRDVAHVLFAAVREHVDPEAEELRVDAELVSTMQTARARYTDDSWTWQR